MPLFQITPNKECTVTETGLYRINFPTNFTPPDDVEYSDLISPAEGSDLFTELPITLKAGEGTKSGTKIIEGDFQLLAFEESNYEKPNPNSMTYIQVDYEQESLKVTSVSNFGKIFKQVVKIYHDLKAAIMDIAVNYDIEELIFETYRDWAEATSIIQAFNELPFSKLGSITFTSTMFAVGEDGLEELLPQIRTPIKITLCDLSPELVTLIETQGTDLTLDNNFMLLTGEESGAIVGQ